MASKNPTPPKTPTSPTDEERQGAPASDFILHRVARELPAVIGIKPGIVQAVVWIVSLEVAVVAGAACAVVANVALVSSVAAACRPRRRSGSYPPAQRCSDPPSKTCPPSRRVGGMHATPRSVQCEEASVART